MKFMIFYHCRIEEPHYDLMLEADDSLDTWRIPEASLDPLLDGSVIDAVLIHPHDKKFLNYEGELSAGKGYVKIYDKGTSSYIRNGNPMFEALIFGTKVSGKLIFNKIESNIFKLRFIRMLNSIPENENIC